MILSIQLIKKLLKYSLVGVCNTLVCIGVIYWGASIGLHYSVYTALGYLCSLVVSFFLNLFYTFQVREQIVKRMTMFFVVNLSDLLIVELIQYYLIEHYGMSRLLAIGCGMIWYTATGFFLNNRYVYNSDKRR